MVLRGEDLISAGSSGDATLWHPVCDCGAESPFMSSASTHGHVNDGSSDGPNNSRYLDCYVDTQFVSRDMVSTSSTQSTW